MNILEHLGQLVMPRLTIDSYRSDAAYRGFIEELVRRKQAGGFCVFGGNTSTVVRTIEELCRINNDLLFSCDCEFGLPMRLSDGGTEFPDAMAIAKTGELEFASKVGRAIAKEMRAIGLQWNFAPVADVNSNLQNPIINTRSFGEMPEVVSEYGSAFMDGLQSEEVAATAKHFPGHGDTSQDSHRELPIIERNWDRFKAVELVPFQALIDRGVASVMTGHLSAPNLAEYLGAPEKERNFPATLSKTLTTSLLRERMNFSGVIVTDSLEMHAITKHFGEENATILSLEAGADMVLMPPSPNKAFNAILSAVQEGRIGSAAIEEKIERIRSLKNRFQIERKEMDGARLKEYAKEHSNLADEIAGKAIEVKGTPNITNAKFVILADERGNAMEKATLFAKSLPESIDSVEVFTPSSFPTGKRLDSGTILITVHRARGYIGGIDPASSIPAIIRQIGASNISLRGLILIGSPYLDKELSMEPSFVIKTFSESRASALAAAHVLLNPLNPRFQ